MDDTHVYKTPLQHWKNWNPFYRMNKQWPKWLQWLLSMMDVHLGEEMFRLKKYSSPLLHLLNLCVDSFFFIFNFTHFIFDYNNIWFNLS
jgi:hypothetical protein